MRLTKLKALLVVPTVLAMFMVMAGCEFGGHDHDRDRDGGRMPDRERHDGDRPDEHHDSDRHDSDRGGR